MGISDAQPPLAAAIYARKSTEQAGRDADDKSVARQVENATRFAEARGWTVSEAHVFVDDAVSGADVKRLVSKRRMLALVESGRAPFQALVMQSNDRLSRRDGHEAFGELVGIAQHGVQVWFYSDGSRFEHGTFASNTLGFLRAEFAAEYRRSVAAKTREALVRKAERGFVTGGRCFGYANVRGPAGVTRQVDEAEAEVVREVFRLYAEGHGLPAIAARLNARRAPCPRPQQGRVAGWAPSSVRCALLRQAYRGVLVHDPVRVPVPELRIVAEDLARRVDARFALMRARSLPPDPDRPVGRPCGRSSGEGSKHLLTGLLRCAECGGTMEVLTSPSTTGERLGYYACSVRRRKGPACCTNARKAPMRETDAAVLRAVGETLLAPDVVERAVALAIEELSQDRATAERPALEAHLAEEEAAVRRLTSAIALGGGELAPLVDALRQAERRRQECAAGLEALRQRSRVPLAADLRRRLRGYLGEWEGVLLADVPRAQQALRRLVDGRLAMAPQPDGSYRFSGTGSVEPVLEGMVELPVRALASPGVNSGQYAVRALASPACRTRSYATLPLSGGVPPARAWRRAA